MRARGPAAFVLALVLAGPALAGAQPDSSSILRLMGISSVAHACPVSSDVALTNAHVADDRAFSWSTARGEQGLLRVLTSSQHRDIAIMVPPPGSPRFTRWYRVAKVAPQPGERLTFIGYDWRTRKNAFAERVFETRVLRVLGGHLIMTTAGVPGSSGSCVFNEAGEVAAINAGGKGMGDKGDEVVGVAVGVWAPWFDLALAQAKAAEAAQ